jgi:hypothetical protein
VTINTRAVESPASEAGYEIGDLILGFVPKEELWNTAVA